MILPLLGCSALLFSSVTLGGPAPAPASPLTSPMPSADDTDVEKLAATASNTFGLELFRSLAKTDPSRNLFISPYSMSVALSMTAEGARRETEREMAAVLHFPNARLREERAITSVHTGYKSLAGRFRDAAGNVDPKTRARIETLRTQLDEANKKSVQLERDQKWIEVGASERQARTIAKELNALLVQVDRFDLRVANALWVERTFSLVPDYVTTIDRYYGTGGVTPLDFVRDAEASRIRINAWVEQHTEQRIKDLIPPGGITASTRLAITNAVYFKGQWAEPFDEQSTQDQDFLLPGGKTTKVRLMQDRWRGGTPYAAFTGAGEFFDTPREVPADVASRPATYPDDHGFQMIELPYKGGELSMVVLVPRAVDGLAELESKLTAASLDSWMKRLGARTVDAQMPRFKMESAHEMSKVLKELGMMRAFISPDQPGGAQFEGMSSSEDPAQQLYIGAVLHKAWVEVTEKGTEAAAATAVLMAPGASAQPPKMVPFNPTVRADRPFLFVIRDMKSGLILFVGRVVEPKM